jgi:predicted nucleic acid-binding protein
VKSAKIDLYLEECKDMILIDTNVFIYFANGTTSPNTLQDNDLAFASITKIEALSYAKITVAEQSYLESLFAECYQLDLDEATIKQAIRLRQRSKMGLGNAIIAATALENDCELWTANERDFADVENLRVHNPLNDS